MLNNVVKRVNPPIPKMSLRVMSLTTEYGPVPEITIDRDTKVKVTPHFLSARRADEEALSTISNIIYSRQKDGQLDDSNLSKGEIFLIKRAFLNVWKRIRHRRIQYPTSKNNIFS